MLGKFSSVSKPGFSLSVFTPYRTTATWSQRRSPSFLTSRWSTHPISLTSSSPNPSLYRSRQNLRWSTTRRLIQLRVFPRRNGCTSPGYTTNLVNGWTITRVTTPSARVSVNYYRRHHRCWGQSHLQRWIQRK